MRTTTFVRRRSCQTFLCLAYAGCGAAPCLAATDFFFTHRLRDWLDHLPFGMIDFVRRKSERLDCGACSVPPHTHTNTIADSLPEPRAQSLGHCPDAGSRSASHQGKNRPGWTATGVFCHSQLFRGVQFINFWIVRGKKREGWVNEGGE